MLFPPNEQKMNKTSPGFSLKNFCRTCVTTIIDQNNGEQATRITKYIYETPTEDSKATLMDLLLMVEPQIKVDLDDDLPKIMCLNCIEQLQMAYAFIETYKEANEKLLKLLKEVERFEDSEADQCHYDDESYTEKQHFVLVDGEVVRDEQYIEKYDVEIEKIPATNHKVTNEDTWETRELKTGWPEFEEEPILDMSNGDEDDREYFSDPCNEVSDDNWNTDEALKSKKLAIKKSSSKRGNKCKNKRSSDEFQETGDEELQASPTKTNGSISSKDAVKNKVGRPKKTYDCEHCGKVFSRLACYTNHIRVHTGEQPFLCIECGKSFKAVSSLNTHMLRHRGEKKVQCPHCPKKFVCASGLYGHMMVHNRDDKPYVCDICGSSFHMAYMLRKHNLYHKGIKNYPCEYCDLRFVTAEKQRRHMRTHTGEKPYKCAYCDRAFAQSNDCNKHLKQHLGENIYQCELCPLRFPLARDLRVHFATHKDDDEETRKRNLEARIREESNLRIKLGLK